MSALDESKGTSTMATRRSTRLSNAESKLTCAVEGCFSSFVKGEKSVAFFEPPSVGKQHCSSRSAWFKAIPSLNTLPNNARKVCEKHFVDGRPTTENAVPTLHLPSSRKRPISPPESTTLFDTSKIVKVKEEMEEAPPVKKTIQFPSSGLKWRTSDGAPKLLAFDNGQSKDKKVIRLSISSNGVLRQLSNGNSASAAPKPNLATMLASAGLSIDPAASHDSAPSLDPAHYMDSYSSTSTRGAGVTRCLPSTSARTLLIPSTSSAQGDPSCRISDPVCHNCANSLPQLRRSLGRLEARMDAVSSMVKQLVSRHPQTIANTIKLPPRQIFPNRGIVKTPRGTLLKSMDANSISLVPQGSKPQLTASKDYRLMPNTFMHKMVSKGLLLYRAECFTVEEYMRNAPNAVKAYTHKQIAYVIGQLIKDGLIKKVDESVSLTDVDCIFEKEKDVTRLGNLHKYGLSPHDFLAGIHDL